MTGLAQIYWNNGERDQAAATLTTVLEAQPDYAPALYLTGRIAIAEKDRETAERCFRAACEVDPRADYLWALLEVVEETQRSDIEDLFVALGASHDTRALSLHYATLGKGNEEAVALAMDEYERRQDVFTCDTVAWALANNGQLKEAQRYMHEALAVGYRDARIYLHAAWISHANGDLQQAKKHLERAKKLEWQLLPSEARRLAEISDKLAV